MGVGDVISQICIEGNSLKEYQWTRTARFFGLGSLMVVRVFVNVLYIFSKRKIAVSRTPSGSRQEKHYKTCYQMQNLTASTSLSSHLHLVRETAYGRLVNKE